MSRDPRERVWLEQGPGSGTLTAVSRSKTPAQAPRLAVPHLLHCESAELRPIRRSAAHSPGRASPASSIQAQRGGRSLRSVPRAAGGPRNFRGRGRGRGEASGGRGRSLGRGIAGPGGRGWGGKREGGAGAEGGAWAGPVGGLESGPGSGSWRKKEGQGGVKLPLPTEGEGLEGDKG